MSSKYITPSQEEIKKISESIQKNLKGIKEASLSDLEMNENELDSEALKTNKLYAKYLDLYQNELIFLKTLNKFKKGVYFERWKYYNGKMSTDYYKQFGLAQETILKTDIDKYLGADHILSDVEVLYETQKMVCESIEKIMDQIKNRGFLIKSAIDWRRFTSGY